LTNADFQSSTFNMSHLTHGGRIVPILTTGHEHQVKDELPQTADPLLDQQAELSAKTHQNNTTTMDHASLEMPCLKERGLFALPTEGDGKLVTLVVTR
jgi:hypothetical protein